MRTKTKVLLLSLCAVLLVVSTVFATMAFLTSKDQVTNTFTVGNVKITLDEAKVDLYGESEGESRVKANTYKLIPGHSYTKDPTVHVASGSEDCWLFVKLENGLKDIIADTTVEAQMTAKGWACIDTSNNIWAYCDFASANDNVVVFESFKLENNANVASYENATITVIAYAIQKDGFETANAAWNAAGTEAQG